MRLFTSLLQAGILLSAVASSLAASWSFTDASITITNKGSGASPQKEKLLPNVPYPKTIPIDQSTSLKLILTTTSSKSPSKPHQAHLLLYSPSLNLDTSFPLSVKESGKSTLTLSLKDLPVQFLRSSSPITANLVIASFGKDTTGYNSPAFTITTQTDTAATPISEKPLRYGKQPEIHHVFKSDPTSPPKLISLVFAAATAATVPILLGGVSHVLTSPSVTVPIADTNTVHLQWLYLGANISHLPKALNSAPVSHALFIGSIVGLEGVLFMYYTSWNLFQTLPVLGVLGVVALVSGSRALTEVQERRLAGLR